MVVVVVDIPPTGNTGAIPVKLGTPLVSPLTTCVPDICVPFSLTLVRVDPEAVDVNDCAEKFETFEILEMFEMLSEELPLVESGKLLNVVVVVVVVVGRPKDYTPIIEIWGGDRLLPAEEEEKLFEEFDEEERPELENVEEEVEPEPELEPKPDKPAARPPAARVGRANPEKAAKLLKSGNPLFPRVPEVTEFTVVDPFVAVVNDVLFTNPKPLVPVNPEIPNPLAVFGPICTSCTDSCVMTPSATPPSWHPPSLQTNPPWHTHPVFPMFTPVLPCTSVQLTTKLYTLELAPGDRFSPTAN